MEQHRQTWRLVVGLLVLGLAALACSLPGAAGSDEATATPFVVTATPEAAAVTGEGAGEAGGQGPILPETSPQGQAESSEAAPTAESSGEVVQARANVRVNIRERPGEGCRIIGFVPKDIVINLRMRTTSPSEYWYETDFLGPDQPGWVYHEPLTLLNDDSGLPRVPEQLCAFCGDGVVNQSSEQCDGGGCAAGYSCDNSCQCVRGPYCGDGVVNQSSEQCDSSGCSSGYTCNSSCQCVKEEYCGDGSVNQSWEECDGGGCRSGYTCQECQCVPEEEEEYCGDGSVNQSWEECDGGGCRSGYTCQECQCVPESFCGDGVCDEDAGENPCSCPGDCTWGVCLEPIPVLPFCGDGICNEADPCSCEQDCGLC